MELYIKDEDRMVEVTTLPQAALDTGLSRNLLYYYVVTNQIESFQRPNGRYTDWFISVDGLNKFLEARNVS